MKQDQHNIDNLFNRGFQDFEPTPPPPVWNNVQSHLQKRKRRRLLPFFWISSLLGIGLFGYYLGNNDASRQAARFDNAQSLNNTSQAISSNNVEPTIQQENILSISNKKITFGVKELSSQTRKINIALEKAISNTISQNDQLKPQKAETLLNKPQNEVILIETLLPKPVKWNKNILFTKAKKEDCYSFNKKNWQSLAIEAYVGGAYFQPILATKSNEPNNYQSIRDSSEKYVLAADAGLWLNPVHRSGLGIRTGLNGSRWIEKLDRVNAYEEKFQMIVTQIKDNQGNLIKNDTSFGWVRGRLVQKYYNHYTALNIPLQIGFEYLKKDKIQFFAYAGAMLNLRFWSKGEIYDDSEKIISFPSPNKVFETNLGISLISHLGMRHRLSEHWWLTESIQCNYTLKSMTTGTHPLEQRNINAGIQVGLRYKF